MNYKTRDKCVDLTTKSVLERVTEAEIYRHYLGKDYIVNGIFSSPFREDKNPSFGIQYFDNHLYWKDFGREDAGDVWSFVQKATNTTFYEAISHINKSMNLNIGYNNVEIKSEPIRYEEYGDVEKIKIEYHIQRLTQPFTNADKDFWSSGHVSKKTLDLFGIKSTKKLYINTIAYWVYSVNNPLYSWEQNGKVKAYRPLEKNVKKKWINNCNKDMIQGWEQLPELGSVLVITKSLKDVCVYYEIGIASIAPQSEILLSDEILDGLHKRFDTIIVNFDYDDKGIGAMKKYNEIGIPSFIIPIESECKDAFEYSKEYGIEAFEKIFYEYE